MSEHVWYVGIGSMMNGTALGLRGICPARSLWCEIVDHRRVFYGPATLCEEAGAVVHAVAHELTPRELEQLEAREPPSKPVRILLRGGSNAGEIVNAFASVDFRTTLHGMQAQKEQIGEQVQQKATGAIARLVDVSPEGISVNFTNRVPFSTEWEVTINGIPAGVPAAVSFPVPPAALPSARYVNLMVEGAKAVGMDPTEIEKIASTPCSPRKSPSELVRIPVCAEAQRVFSGEELRSGSYVVFRGMVLAPEETGAWAPSMNTRLYNGIRDVSHDISRQIYDPLYGQPPASPYEPWDGWPFIEDICMNGPWLRGYRHVGWAAPESKL